MVKVIAKKIAKETTKAIVKVIVRGTIKTTAKAIAKGMVKGTAILKLNLLRTMIYLIAFPILIKIQRTVKRTSLLTL